jgi:predicted regulator of Ras-like GTPase activity (Roadblock/LC7/MglB family)
MEDRTCCQLTEARMEKIQGVIVEILQSSGAKCGLLIDSGGNILARKGFTLIREIENLAVLIAAGRATTREIARILGQEALSVIFHQGSGDHIHSTDVGQGAILTLIFDDRADIGKIQKMSAARRDRLADLLQASRRGNFSPLPSIENLRRQADKRLSELFVAPSDSTKEARTEHGDSNGYETDGT